MTNVGLLRTALTLIGTTCANFVSETTCVDQDNRSPYATYSAGRWCDQCIARTALNGQPFPTPTRQI